MPAHMLWSLSSSQLLLAAPLLIEYMSIPVPAIIIAMPGSTAIPVRASMAPKAMDPAAISVDHAVIASHTDWSFFSSTLFSAAPLLTE